MKKEEDRLKPRGLRLKDKTWKQLSSDGKKRKTSASDIGREIIENHYEQGKK